MGIGFRFEFFLPSFWQPRAKGSGFTGDDDCRGPRADGTRVYAIGDIHGRLDLLNSLMDKIERDIRARPIADPVILTIGDYVDRGEHSRGVLDRLSADLTGSARTIHLRGNHELVFVRFIETPDDTSVNWLQHGGTETLQSYGVVVRPGRENKTGRREMREELKRNLPPEHIYFLSRLTMSATIGDYFFAHAGARAGVPLDQQSDDDLLWMRQGFADADHPFEKVVVHGHTPVEQVEIHQHRIAIDTGAYASNLLAALVLEGGDKKVLTA